MATIKEILANKAAYPDDTKLTIAGVEVTFGELRKQNDESQGELAQQLATRQADIERRHRETENATTNLANIVAAVSERTGLSVEQIVSGQIPPNLRETVATVAQGTTLTSGLALKDDPLYKPLIDQYLQPAMNDIGTLKHVMATSINAYKNDRARLGYLEFVTGEKPDGFKATYQEVLTSAVQKGYKDDVGFPDTLRAARELAQPIIEKKNSTKTFDDGVKEGERRAREQQLSQLNAQPGAAGSVAGISFSAVPDNKTGKAEPVKDFRSQLNAAFQDAEIMAPLTGSVQ